MCDIGCLVVNDWLDWRFIFVHRIFRVFMKKLVVVFLAFCLSACSSQFAYNNLDWLVHWYIDDFIELNEQQEEAFDLRFARWQSWHRKEELLEYEKHLIDLKAMLQSAEFDKSDVLHHFDRGRGHWERFRDHVVEDISSLSGMLTDQQITVLFAKLEKKNQKEYDERQGMSEDEIKESFEDNFKDQMRDYFGRLSKAQKRLVETAAADIIPNRLEWITYRRNIQEAAKNLMLQRHSRADYQAEFSQLLSHPESFQHPLYVQNNQHNRAVFAQMFVDLYQTLSAKQKRKLFRKIDNYIEDFSELREDA